MAGEIEFTTNYSDLNTDIGFRFEFRCNRCGIGYRTEFDTFELSAATNTRFCAQCGTDLKAAKHCTQCGAKLEPSAKFCSGCGSPSPWTRIQPISAHWTAIFVNISWLKCDNRLVDACLSTVDVVEPPL